MKYNYLFIALLLLGAIACNDTKKSAEVEESVETVLPKETNDVTVMALQPTVFNHELVSNGKLSAKRFVDLKFQTPEIITSILVKNGDYVKKGQKLAVLDKFRLSNKTAQAKESLERARLELKDVLIGQGYAPSDSANIPEAVWKLARVKSGYDQSQSQYELAAYEERNATLTAPFNGVVANLFARQLNTASTADVFCTIIDNRSLEAAFTVLESELPLIQSKDRVDVKPFALKEITVAGNISEINPFVDENGMVQVKAKVANNTKLFEGMNVQIRVHRSLGKQLVIPKTALVLRSGKQVVFTLVDGKAFWNYVRSDLENTSSYTIVEGLKDGDQVITSGNINLAHESPVNVIE